MVQAPVRLGPPDPLHVEGWEEQEEEARWRAERAQAAIERSRTQAPDLASGP